MTATLISSRPLAQQLLARSTRPFTRLSTNPLLRVSCTCLANGDRPNRLNDYVKAISLLKHSRTYATAAPKPGRPKAHTGRAPVKRTTSTSKSTATTKKPATKPKKKAAKKVKTRVKKAPSKTTLLKKAREEQANLKATALLAEPKKLAQTAYTLVFSEESKKVGDVKSKGSAAAEKYKNLSPADRERYNHEAVTNKEKNEQAYKQWVSSHSPLQIKEANNARRLLTRKAKEAGKKKHYPTIKDDRIVKLPSNAYVFFVKERQSSGDFSGLSITEAGKLIGQEWKQLSGSEKKTFEDSAQADRNRYLEEYKTVYGKDAPVTKRKAT